MLKKIDCLKILTLKNVGFIWKKIKFILTQDICHSLNGTKIYS